MVRSILRQPSLYASLLVLWCLLFDNFECFWRPQLSAMEQDATILLLVLLSICWTGGHCGPIQDGSPLGLESGAIPDSSLTASSEYDANHGPFRGRLNIAKVGALTGGWSAKTNDLNQWIQVDLLATYSIIRVATQGREDYSQWVTSFKIACSMDSVTFDTVKDPTNTDNDNIFPGNSDRNTVVYNRLPVPMLCRYVRILPYTWHDHISLRMELFGEYPATTEPTTNPTTLTPVQSEILTSQPTVGPIQDGSPLGLESGAIPDSSLTAFSEWDANHGPRRGRLNMAKVGAQAGGWSAKTTDLNQWIQVDLLATYRIVRVATQGRADYSQWVTSFKIACSMDNVTFDTVKDPTNTDNDNIFPGNSDRNTVVYNRFPVPMSCRYVRLLPYTWHQHISLRMELFGELLGHFQDASPIGLESGAIPDSSLTASSEYDANHGPFRGRLNIARDGALYGGWSAKTNDLNQWIQVDLLATYSIVGVATQGRQDYSQWVTSFKIACSIDSTTFDTVKDPTNTDTDNIFPGNSDRYTVVYNRFPVPISCRYVRILPYTWHERIALRMELFEELLASTEVSTTLKTSCEGAVAMNASPRTCTKPIQLFTILFGVVLRWLY
ncbi:lactadherin isoform X2 [Strongylocentrotus purpuratus]|uniref:F5/8 type C domain-containing protein n=1 Tax=Strongylocentrotus purpuratus TaxID=7668 RepID=A0A7M7PCA9_STRPU|nr:lactadherin isoform X2 [Strongylocentrotus purpuratus]